MNEVNFLADFLHEKQKLKKTNETKIDLKKTTNKQKYSIEANRNKLPTK